MKLDWNFQTVGGGGLRKNPFRGGGMENFWNHTMINYSKYRRTLQVIRMC